MNDAAPTFIHDQTPSDTPAPAVSDVAESAYPRELFTMTVDHVAAELELHGFRRDERTIQRWCKAGRLRALIDHEHGDRYLIDPSSVRDMIATLRKEEALRAPLSRPVADPAPTAPGARPDVAPTQFQSPQIPDDSPRHDATDAPAQDATPRPGRDDVAKLQARIAELEQEKAMLSVDKEVREQMVTYLKEQFGTMLEQAMTSIEELGQTRAELRFLRAENAELKAALPAPTRPVPPVTPTTGQPEPMRFTPRGVMEREDFMPPPPPVHREDEPRTWGGV